MISIEAARDGFVVSIGGQKLLVHSKRNPCIDLGTAELAFKRQRGGLCARRKGSDWVPLRDFVVVENDPELTVIDFQGQLQMRFHREEELLRLGFSCPDGVERLFRIRFQAFAGEHIYGLGEGAAPLDLKGRRKALWVEEKGSLWLGRRGLLKSSLGLGGQKGNALPLPVFVSSKNYWLALDSSSFASFDFSRRASTVVETWSVPASIYVGSKPSAVGVAKEIRSVLGRPPLLPSWSYDGICLGVDPDQGAPGLEEDLEVALDADAKVGALWSEGLSTGREGSTLKRPIWDSNLGPELQEALKPRIKAWRERGIRYLDYADPYLDRQGPLYPRASAAGYLVASPQGGDYLFSREGQQLALVDLTNPEARAWLKSLLVDHLLAAGASGWLSASGGYLPPDGVVFSREPGFLLHNRWPLLWAALSAEALAVRGKAAEGLLAMESGWFGPEALLPSSLGLHAHPSFDPATGLGSVIPGAISLGLSGLASTHFELSWKGGHGQGPKARECLCRWLEAAAFSPLVRTKAAVLKAPGAKGRLAYDRDFLGALARMSGIYGSLKPYHEAVAAEGQGLGLPALRHPYLHYEGEEELHRRDFQYLYGRDLLVAPSLAGGAGQTEVFLPQDSWVHLWSSRHFKGGMVNVESPLGFPAVFFREASPFAALFDSIRRTARKP